MEEEIGETLGLIEKEGAGKLRGYVEVAKGKRGYGRVGTQVQPAKGSGDISSGIQISI